ncbi:MAG TPA: flagellar biosynthetic protein FliR [Verrucomicrobiae bacterium]|jgi:flagellar biosynthetic protein FliR|nr:flagellar biosynthetic protein FliR [Verrucomicrobiae bacterium]
MLSLNQLISSRWPEVVTFLLVLGRTSGLVMSAPFWGSRIIPGLARAWVSVVLSAASYPFVATVALPSGAAAGSDYGAMLFVLLALAGEILLGIGIGWAAQMLFAGLRLAAQEIEMKMGLSLAQMIDPQWGDRSSSLGGVFELIAVLVFFSFNGHRLLIEALHSSYRVFPLAGSKLDFARLLVGSAGEIFSIALRVSAPVIIGLLLSDIVLGIISRAMPQMNVFSVAMPVQLLLGLLLLFLSLPALVWFCANYVGGLGNQLAALG